MVPFVRPIALLFILLLTGSGCEEERTLTAVGGTEAGTLAVSFRFDPDQPRLDNFGRPATLPSGHAAQTPDFRELSIHYLELVPDNMTPYGKGLVVYRGAEVPFGGNSPQGFTTAIDWSAAVSGDENEIILRLPIESLPATESYRFVRASVSFQRYGVRYHLRNVPVVGDLADQEGEVASFLGYNSRIESVSVGDRSSAVGDFKLQGFWLFATDLSEPYASFNQVTSGQAPATTVVNPLPQNPIPAGSCVVTGRLEPELNREKLTSGGAQLILSFSIDRSFEWEDGNGNGVWDIDVQNPAASERVVDMGLRGLIGRH